MKRILSLLILLCLSFSAHAQVITATVTATSGSGTVNGNTIVLNGTTRIFTNTVTVTATQILNGTNVVSTASNIYNAYLVKPVGGVNITSPTTSTVQFKGFPGAALTLTIGGGWGTVSFSTNGVTDSTYVRVPLSNAGNSERTSVESGIVDYLNDSLGANIIATNAPFFVSFVNTNGNQQISGAKTFNGSINGVVGNLTNGTWTNPSFTNGQNFGNPFRSPGAGGGSEQFGLGASAGGDNAVAFGDNANAEQESAVAIGFSSHAKFEAVALGASASALDESAIAIGTGAAASNINSIAIGRSSIAGPSGAISIGVNAVSLHIGAIAIGTDAATTKTNQIVLGSSSVFTEFVGGVVFSSPATNFTGAGTNTITGQLAFPRKNNTSMANGGNAAIDISTNVNLFLSGNSAAFSTDGIAGGSDGRFVKFTSRSGFTWTIPNESGFETNPTNRVQTGTGATVTLTSNPAWAYFSYDITATRWILEAHSN